MRQFEHRDLLTTQMNRLPMKDNVDNATVPIAGAVHADKHLLQFLTQRDVCCPLYHYNLRDLTEPRCPECGQQLALAVNTPQVHFGWFFATMAPCIGSAFLGAAMLVPTIVVGNPPEAAVVMMVFSLFSAFAIPILIARRIAFISRPRFTQRMWALLVWTVHLIVFGVISFVAFF